MVSAISKLFELYFILIIVRCFLSFFPKVDMSKQPIQFIRDIVDPYLDIFRKVIPCLGGMDFSPIVACIVLEIIRICVCTILDFIF